MSNHNNEDKFSKRAARPQSMAGVMGGFLKMFGARASDSDLVARWGEIMGPEISAVATLAAIKKMRDDKFNVTIRPANPAYTLQLSYMADDITGRINKYFGYDAVGKISFRK